MINQLRKKFVFTALLAISLVLCLLLGTVSIVMYQNLNEQADSLLALISENNNQIPKTPRPNQPISIQDNVKLSPELPYETRFFTISFDVVSQGVTTNTDSIAAISSDVAIEMASTALNSEKDTGFVGNYKYKIIPREETIDVIFLDCTRDLNYLYAFISTSLTVSFIGLVFFFIFTVLLSNFALKPVILSYSKQKRFITDASHELKTPLTIIDANTEVIELLNGESDWTKSTRNQVKRLTELTHSLVALARMDEGGQSLCLSEFSLSERLLEQIDAFSSLAQSKHKVIQSNIPDNTYYNGDDSLITQLIAILLDNAIKYSNDYGTISIDLKSSNKKLKLTFTNTVDLIEAGNQDILFERFYRADASRNSAKLGYGIGLSLAQSIVHLHSGKIKAFSPDQHCIHFTVTLPVKKTKLEKS